jgi:hypothetical protein
MAQRQKGRKVYTTMQGKQIDMDLLRKKNELTPAVGNARVNARGDELGPGGKIIKKREDVVKEYYNNASRPVADEANFVAKKESAPVQEEVSKPVKASRKTTRAQEKEEAAATPTAAELAEFEDMDDEWVEDNEGNFVKKGE